MTASESHPREGGCSCGSLRYRLEIPPMFIHCCHCTWCQRETGTAFALNALLERDRIELLRGETESVQTPSSSGHGQEIVRCRSCGQAIWSHYGGARTAVAFVRVGTLDDAGDFPPDIHIYTSTKLPWVVLDDRVPECPEFYRRSDHWPKESYERYRRAVGKQKDPSAQEPDR